MSDLTNYIRSLPYRQDLRKLASESWSVSWPMILIMFFEFIIGLTDIYIAGRIGKEIQATYGYVIMVYYIFIVIANALTTGTVSVISRLFTSGDKAVLERSVHGAVLATIASGIFFGIAGVAMTPILVRFTPIPQELKQYAIPLGMLYAAGLLFHYIVINTNGILRACKQVRTSLKTMAVVCIMNVVLNFTLVFHTPLGYRGIALSTALSVAIGCALNLSHMRRFLVGMKSASFDSVKAIIKIGWPFGLSQALWQLHSMALFLILGALPKNSIETLAAFSAGLRIESAIFLPAIAFNMANAVIAGNLLGENKKHDAFKAGIITAVMSVIVVTVLTIIVIAGARLIAPALSTNPIVINECVKYLYVSMLSEPFMGFWIVLGGALAGAGDTKGVMLIVASCTWLIRIPLCYLWIAVLGFDAVSVWWTMNLSQFVVAILIFRRYWRRNWLNLPVVH